MSSIKESEQLKTQGAECQADLNNSSQIWYWKQEEKMCIYLQLGFLFVFIFNVQHVRILNPQVIAD